MGSSRQQQLYGLVRYTRPILEVSPTPSLDLTWPSLPRKAIQETSANSTVGVENGNDAKPSNKQRRWGRTITTGAQGELDSEAATSQPLVHDTSSSKEDPTPSVENDSARDVRRLQKALREIGDLEAKRSSGERLRRNQIEKIEKKEQYLDDLQRLAPQLGA